MPTQIMGENAMLLTSAASLFLAKFFRQKNNGALPERPVRLCTEQISGKKKKYHPLWRQDALANPDEDLIFDADGLKIVCNFYNHPELEGVTVDVADDGKVLVFKTPDGVLLS